jgi:polar amino acid transport system permease protein
METISPILRKKSPLSKKIQISQLPWWAMIIVAGGLLITYLILSTQNYYETFVYLKDGVLTTLRITFISYSIAIVLGLITGLARTSKNTLVYTIATLYVEVIRGIPMIVLVLYVAFGVVPVSINLINLFGSWGLSLIDTGALGTFFSNLENYSIRNISMELRAIISLGVGYGAYEAEVFRAGIQSIGRGQMEAALSLGMSYFQAMRFIILPQAIRRVLPPLGNDFVSLLKDSSLATVLAVNELTQLGRKRRSSTFRVFETFNVVVYLYLAMTLLLSALVRFIENKMKIEE